MRNAETEGMFTTGQIIVGCVILFLAYCFILMSMASCTPESEYAEQKDTTVIKVVQ
jgi:hypothetical protein